MKSSASESKPFQSRSKGEIPGRAKRKERLSRSKLNLACVAGRISVEVLHCFGGGAARRVNLSQVTRKSLAASSPPKKYLGQKNPASYAG